ncbi:MAG: ArsA family ATPase [Halolamina sp.]
MSDIDVEAVDSVGEGEPVEIDEGDVDEGMDLETEQELGLPAGVDAPDYVLYGGKGGVGKTTCAAATALASAAGGTRTLVVSTDPAHSLSDTLDVDVPAHPSRLREDIPLWGVEIDPDAAMEEGIFAAQQGEGPMGDVAGMLGEGGMESLLGGTMPGADEAAAMQKLIEHMDDPRFDRVVVDTAPTGHTLRLLQLPEMLDTMVGRMMKLRQRFSGMMDGMKGLFGGGDEKAGEETPELDELKERIERLRTLLRDPNRTDFRVVMVPEEMSVVESERLVERLDEFEVPVNTLVVNRVMEDPREIADLPAVDEEWLATPNLEDCAFCQRRWSVQQDALGQATELFRGREVKRVPLLADEVRGAEALRIVAACLD